MYGSCKDKQQCSQASEIILTAIMDVCAICKNSCGECPLNYAIRGYNGCRGITEIATDVRESTWIVGVRE